MNEAPGQFKYSTNGAYAFVSRMKIGIDNKIGETK